MSSPKTSNPGYKHPRPYTYTDEQWKVHTVDPPRYVSTRKDDGVSRPTRPAPCVSLGNPFIELPSQKEKAAEADLALWASCDSFDEYEAKRAELDRAVNKDKDDNDVAFHLFPRLPPELRCRVWEMAMQEPTRITMACSGYTRAQRGGGWCGTISPGRPRIYQGTAFMPAMMLVDREAHALASRRYRRAFRGVNGGGGVLASYPSVLTIGQDILHLLRGDDFQLLAEVVIIASPTIWGVEFDTGFSERLRMMLERGSIRRLEFRLTRPVTTKYGRRVDEYFACLFSDMKAGNAEWVAPELEVGPVEGEDSSDSDDDWRDEIKIAVAARN